MQSRQSGNLLQSGGNTANTARSYLNRRACRSRRGNQRRIPRDAVMRYRRRDLQAMCETSPFRQKASSHCPNTDG